jgi:plasmid stabilization system protein ParE
LLLEEVGRRLADESPSAAAKLVGDLLDAAESLATLSERGRRVPELNDSQYRELLTRDYRLIYRVTPEEVVIIALIHGARDFRTWWRRFRRNRT